MEEEVDRTCGVGKEVAGGAEREEEFPGEVVLWVGGQGGVVGVFLEG